MLKAGIFLRSVVVHAIISSLYTFFLVVEPARLLRRGNLQRGYGGVVLVPFGGVADPLDNIRNANPLRALRLASTRRTVPIAAGATTGAARSHSV